MDQSDPFHLFPYRAIVDHPPLAWPNGAKVAVWVIPNIEHFHWEIGSGAPDVRNHSRRDYGNRVGHLAPDGSDGETRSARHRSRSMARLENTIRASWRNARG
jgi:hypothetical protein